MKARSSIAFLATTSAILGASASGKAASGAAASLIEKGDAYYDKLQATEALQYYLPAERLEPDNVRLLVRIAREYRHLMSDAAKNDEKVKLGRIAVSYSCRAVGLAPNDPDAQLAMAISYGKVLPLVGSKEQFEASKIIKAAAERVIELDPRNDLGWHVLGRWHVNVADVGAVKRSLANLVYGKMPEGSNTTAIACFQKAIRLNPKRLMHYIELGRTYAQMGQADNARRNIEKGLTMQNTEKDDPETKQKGREILEKLR